MKNLFILLSIVFTVITAFIHLSCQNTPQETEKFNIPLPGESDAAVERKMANNPPPVPAVEYGETLVQTEPVNELVLQLLTDGVWVAEGGYITDDPEGSKKLGGQWLHFYADNNFESGNVNGQERSGKWVYLNETQLLKLDFKEGNDEEYTLKLVGDIMVLVSTKTFESRNLQIKLRRKRENPTGLLKSN